MKSDLTCFSPLKVLLGLLFCLCINHALKAQAKSIRMAPPPDWVKEFSYNTATRPAIGQVSGGVYLECYEEQYNLGKEAVYHREVRQLLTETGVQNNAQIAISFDPSYQQVVFHRIRIIRSGRVINQLDLSKIKLIRNEQDLERFIYSGVYTAYLSLEDVRPGDKVDFAYTLEGRNPILDHEYGLSLYFSSQNTISHLFFRIITAPGQNLQLKYFNKAPEATVAARGKRTVYEWKLSDLPPYVPELGTPFWYYGGPYVLISTFDNWKEVADWALKNVSKVPAKASPALMKLADQFKAQAGNNPLEYATLATRFVQDKIRYMGVEMGVHSHLPHNPDKILQQRYGDCKDKSLLLVVLLRLQHISASVALVNSYSSRLLTQWLPAITPFDHAIVTFKYKGKRYWVDPTISNQGGNIENIATPDYRYALIVHEGEKELRRMHVHSDSRQEIRETFIIPKNNSTDGLLEVVSTYTGGKADQIRQQLKSSSRPVMQKYYIDYYNRQYMHVSLADSLEITDDTVENKIVTTELYHLGDPWVAIDSSGSLRRFSVYAHPISDRLPDAVNDKRQSPVALQGNINLRYRIQLVLPDDGWSIQPASEDVDRTAYHFRFETFMVKDTVNLDYTYQTFQNYIAADSADMLNVDLRKIDGDLSYQLTVNDALLGSSKQASWGAILLGLICLGIFTYFGIRMYRYSPDRLNNTLTEGRAIGGWLILIGIGLCFTPLQLLYLLIDGGYFSEAVWLKAQALSPGVMSLIGFELIANLFLLATAILALFLFFKRRTTFPAVFIFICIATLVILLTDYFMASSYLATPSDTGTQAIRRFVYSAIWIPYMLISKRVKATFVYPYAGKLQEYDNYMPEENGVPDGDEQLESGG